NAIALVRASRRNGMPEWYCRNLEACGRASTQAYSLPYTEPTMFELLNPVYLVGLSAAAIPLIIHLSRSRRTKKMRFSTTRFFTDQFLRSYRMSQLKEIFLLACRMALFALLAMALAQPLVRPSGE